MGGQNQTAMEIILDLSHLDEFAKNLVLATVFVGLLVVIVWLMEQLHARNVEALQNEYYFRGLMDSHNNSSDGAPREIKEVVDGFLDAKRQRRRRGLSPARLGYN